jgi:hypothetical protein
MPIPAWPPNRRGFAEPSSAGGDAMGNIPCHLRFFEEAPMPIDKLMSGKMGFDRLNGEPRSARSR